MDKSFLMVFLKKINIDPTGRQNFGDAPGQIPKLILALCPNMIKLAMFAIIASICFGKKKQSAIFDVIHNRLAFHDKVSYFLSITRETDRHL